MSVPTQIIVFFVVVLKQIMTLTFPYILLNQAVQRGFVPLVVGTLNEK